MHPAADRSEPDGFGIDPTVTSTVAVTTAFLYEGPGAVQSGVTNGTIKPQRASVLRGLVRERDAGVLGGVKVTILDHPELGYTYSRSDGRYDLAVNGGGRLVVDFAKPGFLPAQRKVDVPWQQYIEVPTVALVPLDTIVTTIDFSAPIQVASGSPVTDSDGTRQASVFFKQGTSASMVMPDDSLVPLPTMSVRLTEYTVGPEGPEAMPAELPPTSGYTYAVELSADEAIAAGATGIELDQPASVYVDNFLGFPVGGAVPVGTYDRDVSCWVPSENGTVIKILGEVGGLAEIDVDGTGLPASGATLLALGFDDAERAELNLRYQPGDQVWRVQLDHFSPVDANWPANPPSDAGPPGGDNGPKGKKKKKKKKGKKCYGLTCPDDDNSDKDCRHKDQSTIAIQSQVLSEEIPIVGTDYTLNYVSSRTPGRITGRTMDITIAGSTLPPSLARIDLSVYVAGQTIDTSFLPLPNQDHQFSWDGKDAYGRPLQGQQSVEVELTYVFPAVYTPPSGSSSAFGISSPSPNTGYNPARDEFLYSRRWRGLLNSGDAVATGLGGWSVDVHHVYDPTGRAIRLGSGETHAGVMTIGAIHTIAGGGAGAIDPKDNEGEKATAVDLDSPFGVEAAPDGRVYFADTHNEIVWRMGLAMADLRPKRCSAQSSALNWRPTAPSSSPT